MIDMHHHPDGSYHWTGHYMDHVLFPLKQKCAKQVALSLMTKVFCYFGSSRIIQSEQRQKCDRPQSCEKVARRDDHS